MAYALFSQVKDWVKSASGECDDTALAGIVNDIRREFYLMYQELPLFLDVVECFELQCFEQPCLDNIQKSYRGITLPRGWQTPEAMWLNDSPVLLRSGWREYMVGIRPQCESGLASYDQGNNFVTERELPLGYKGEILVRCMNPADKGKVISIRGMNQLKQHVTYDIPLTMQYQATPVAMVSIDQPGGVVKEATVGEVIIASEDHRVLSRYAPDERVPAYRRLKLTGVPDQFTHVNIRAAREYIELSGENDVVETDNKLAFQEMAHFIRINRKTIKDRNDLASMGFHYTRSKGLLLGEKSRDLGKSTHTQMTIRTPTFGYRRLNRQS